MSINRAVLALIALPVILVWCIAGGVANALAAVFVLWDAFVDDRTLEPEDFTP